MRGSLQLIAQHKNNITVYSQPHLHVPIPLASIPSQGYTKVKEGHNHLDVVFMLLAKEGRGEFPTPPFVNTCKLCPLQSALSLIFRSMTMLSCTEVPDAFFPSLYCDNMLVLFLGPSWIKLGISERQQLEIWGPTESLWLMDVWTRYGYSSGKMEWEHKFT